MSQHGFQFPQSLSDKYQPNAIGERLRGAMRTHAIDVSCLIAIPAKQPEVIRETKFDDYVVPPPARHAIVLRLSRVVATWIDIAVFLRVINREEFLRILTATRALVPVVRKDDSFTLYGLVTLPCEYVRPSFATRLPGIRGRLTLTLHAQIRSTSRLWTLKTKTGSLTLCFPNSTYFCIRHARHSNAEA
jgi:hypothetical protein